MSAQLWPGTHSHGRSIWTPSRLCIATWQSRCLWRLGADQVNFTLNFSKGASQIVAQYYQVGTLLS